MAVVGLVAFGTIEQTGLVDHVDAAVTTLADIRTLPPASSNLESTLIQG